MNPSLATLIDAFALPPTALVQQRIAKKLLAEQGAPTAADKRLIHDAIDELIWHAVLKPGTVSVAATPEGVGSSRVDLQACKLEYSIVSPK